MSDYTPTTERVRDSYVRANDNGFEDDYGVEFDRWLAQHDAETYQRGHDDGYMVGRRDEREQAAKRVRQHMEAMQADETDIEFVEAAARGDVADKSGESTGGHGGLVSRASFEPSSAATVHNIDDPDAIVNVRNAAVVNINQTQNLNVWS